MSDVLAGNASNYDAAMKIFVDGCGREACGGGFAAESDARIVAQVPEPGILSLLGMGLLAMGLPALRRRLA